MARQRSPDSIKAEEMYIKSKGKMQLNEIAEKIGVAPGTVRSWKNRYKWDDKLNGNSNATLQKEKKNKRNVANKKKEQKPKHIKVIENLDLDIEKANLTEKQRLFCLYYIKLFNATQAAIKAGYAKESAHVTGSQLLRNPKVAEEIRRLKGVMTNEIFIDAMDILNKYIKIAFVDMNDFVEYGNKEIPELDEKGNPILDDEGNPVTRTINYLNFKNSDEVDGTLICEIKTGKQGMSIKLEDRMKALEKLEKYFDLFPDKFKRRIEEEKLKITQEKLELEKVKINSETKDINREGIEEFIKATSISEDEIKELFEGEEDGEEKEED